MRLNADLVVLSACNTGLGRNLAGEGMMGLTRAFHYAGARAVTASSWPVADRATAAYMAAFYGRLKAGMNQFEALRQTQVHMIQEPVKSPKSGILASLFSKDADFSHPYFWAPFQYYGPWD